MLDIQKSKASRYCFNASLLLHDEALAGDGLAQLRLGLNVDYNPFGVDIQKMRALAVAHDDLPLAKTIFLEDGQISTKISFAAEYHKYSNAVEQLLAARAAQGDATALLLQSLEGLNSPKWPKTKKGAERILATRRL